MARTRAMFGLLFGGLAVVIALILTGWLDEVLPDGLATHVARNNEGYVFAVLFAVWVEYLRDRASATTTTAVAAGCGLAGAVLLADGIPASLATLNETFFALAVLVPYTKLRRPVPPWAWALPAAAILTPLIGAGNDDVTDLAELFGFLVVVPIGVDFVDRAILDPTVRRRGGRWIGGWMVVVAGAAITFHAMRPDSPAGSADEVWLYLSRTIEALGAMLILHLYFSILTRWRGRSRPAPVPAEPGR